MNNNICKIFSIFIIFFSGSMSSFAAGVVIGGSTGSNVTPPEAFVSLDFDVPKLTVLCIADTELPESCNVLNTSITTYNGSKLQSDILGNSFTIGESTFYTMSVDGAIYSSNSETSIKVTDENNNQFFDNQIVFNRVNGGDSIITYIEAPAVQEGNLANFSSINALARIPSGELINNRFRIHIRVAQDNLKFHKQGIYRANLKIVTILL